MPFVATLALEDAYDTFADAQIDVQKAANVEGFPVTPKQSRKFEAGNCMAWLQPWRKI